MILVSESGSDRADEALANRAGAAILVRRPFLRDVFLPELDRALMLAPIQKNPLASLNPTEESAFLRDYNAWLTRMLYRSTTQLETTTADRDLHGAHLHAMNAMTTALGESLDFDRTIRTLLDKTAELIRAGVIALYVQEEGDRFTLRQVAGYGLPTPTLANAYHLESISPLKLLMAGQGAILFKRREQLRTLEKQFGLATRPASAIISPLLWRGTLSGFLLVLRADEPFEPRDAEILSSLAGVAGLSLWSAQLFTDLERAYAHLQEMDRRRSEFVAITSHELRTPIAIMLGYASLLHDLEEDELKKTQLAAIEKQASFLTGMVDTLINLHELIEEEKPIALKCRSVAVDELLRDALDVTLQHSHYEKIVDFRLDCDPVKIDGDEVRLLLAFNNLMDNAMKFSPPDGTVEILGAEQPEGGVVITIQDFGPGIAQEHFEKIFEPFYQVEPALTRKYGGMGLGLSIVRGMIHLHGGHIEIRSQVGHGTRFIITLPAKPPAGRCQEKLF